MTLLELTRVKKIQYTSILFISIPLVLSAFTHLWNPVGFPGIHYDEGIYMRRALHVLEGQGPQEPGRFDHPYFGQLFLAGVFRLLGYPDSIDTSNGDIHSMENLYMVPRVLMGLLAVVDTFLIYKISQYRYNRNVALIASILFAVMPLSWLTRRIYLDSIQLPFLLSSILFAVYPYMTNYNKKNNYNYNYNNNNNLRKSSSNKSTKNNQLGSILYITTKNSASNNSNNGKNILMIILSGVFLGIAIFTKIPAFTMIPMVGFLVYMNYRNSGVSVLHLRKNKNKNKNTNNNSSEKSRSYFTIIPSFFGSFLQFVQNKKIIVLALWIIPVILIPAIWPAYAISIGQFHKWTDGIHWQASQRVSNGISESLKTIYAIDPVLVAFGIAGFIFAAIRRDILLILWIVPFVIFFTFVVSYISWFHWIPIIPGFCIATAKLMVDIAKRISRYIKVQQIIVGAIIAEFCIFGLVSSGILLNTNFASFQLNAAAYVAHHLIEYKATHAGDHKSHDITVVSSPMYSWIYRYVYDKNDTLSGFRDRQPVRNENVLLMVDNYFSRFLSQSTANQSKPTPLSKLQAIYDDSHKIAEFKGITSNFNRDVFPYTSIRQNYGGSKVQIRTTY